MTDELLRLARNVAVEGAGVASRLRMEGVSVAATKSSAVDIVTEADRAVEAHIRGRLAAARPSDGFVGEESGSAGSMSGVTWIVDPIDGTVNYLYGVPFSSVSIAAVEGEPVPGKWRLLAAAVCNIFSGDLFTAAAGQGAWLSDRWGRRELQIAPPPPLAESLLATGFAYSEERRRAQGATIAQILPQVRDIRRLGSAALDISYVAVGRVDAFFETGIEPWDYAAGLLIAEEAGARSHVSESGRVAVAHPVLLESLVAALDAAE